MTTKKEILHHIELNCIRTPLEDFGRGYQKAVSDLFQLIQQLPDYEWIPFSERMPSDEDYINANGTKLILAAYGEDLCFLPITFNIDIMSKRYTHWKRITLPNKQLSAKAEILEKLGLSEEELKEIICQK